jgi:hypothetical protein
VPCDSHCSDRTVHTTYAAALKTTIHPSTNSVQKAICCKSTFNAPDDGRMRSKHVELRMHRDGISHYFIVRHCLDCQITFRQRNQLYHSYNDQSHKRLSDMKHTAVKNSVNFLTPAVVASRMMNTKVKAISVFRNITTTGNRGFPSRFYKINAGYRHMLIP